MFLTKFSTRLPNACGQDLVLLRTLDQSSLNAAKDKKNYNFYTFFVSEEVAK